MEESFASKQWSPTPRAAESALPVTTRLRHAWRTFSCRAQLAHLCTKRMIGCLLLGQLISLLITTTGVCNQLLSERGVTIPTTQSLLNYVLLAVTCVPFFLVARSRETRWSLRVRWFWYPLLALADVEANYFGTCV